MSLFGPKWSKNLPAVYQLSGKQIVELEKLRVSWGVPEEVFLTHFGASPAGLSMSFQWYMRLVMSKTPNADTQTIFMVTYAMMLLFFKQVKLVEGQVERQLLEIMSANSRRFHRLSRVVKSLDDLVMYYILERGAYSDVEPEVREFYRRVDLLLGWNCYAVFSHVLPSSPVAPETYSGGDLSKFEPFVEEMGRRFAARSESLITIAQDIGTRAGVHPVSILDIIADQIDKLPSDSHNGLARLPIA